MKNFLRYSFMLAIVAIFISLLAACESRKPSVTKEDLIKQSLTKKITELHRSKKERCTNEALEAASLIVDSILIERARLEKDNTAKPEKPTKPEYPDVFILQDTGKVRPLFEG